MIYYITCMCHKCLTILVLVAPPLAIWGTSNSLKPSTLGQKGSCIIYMSICVYVI